MSATNGNGPADTLDLDALHHLRAQVDPSARRLVTFAGLAWRLPGSLPLAVAVYAEQNRLGEALGLLIDRPEWVDAHAPPPTTEAAVAHLLDAGITLEDLEAIITAVGGASVGKSSGSPQSSPTTPSPSPPTSSATTASTSPPPVSTP